MTWDEVQFADALKLWTVPGERMKVGVAHDVPLSDAAVVLLRGQLATRRPASPTVSGARSATGPPSTALTTASPSNASPTRLGPRSPAPICVPLCRSAAR
jgi:integrase